jgi:fengycin family lipopeptide synthetase D
VEQKLVETWAEVLGISKKIIGIDDDFFQLGGHSLKATTMVFQVYQELNVNIEIAEVFANPTIRQLAQQIKDMEEMEYIKIEPAEQKEYYGLSYAQRRLWVLCQFEEDSTAYNIPGAIMLSGLLRKDALEKAIQALAHRHESLRTAFISIDGDPYQKIINDFTYNLEEIDLAHLDDETKEKKTRAIYTQHANKAFNLEKAPLFQFKLIRLQERSYLLIHNVHHIISDGWSQGIIHNETIRLYNAFLSRKEFPLAPLRLQYKDYTYWHNRIIAEGFFNASREYWWEKFKDKPNGIELPLDYSRKPIQTFNGGRVTFTIDKQRTSQLYRLSLQEDATFFMSLLTLVCIFLYRYSGQTDIIIGAPIANRKHPELHQMIGFLVNTLIYRNRVTPGDSFRELLGKVKQDALACYKYQDYPFDLLVELLELDRDLSQSPLFNVMLAHNNTETQNIDLQMEGMTPSEYPHGTDFNMSKFDLIFFMDEFNDEVYTRIEYNSDLFEHSTIRRMADNFLILLDSIIAGYDAPVFSLKLLSDTQYDQVISQFNETGYSFPPLSLQELFEQQAVKSGEKTAVVFNDDSITYAGLDKKTNRLAHYLKRKYHIKPNDVIGVSMDRSIRMIVVLMGIIKSGAAYLAVDPTYPRERVLHVLSDSRSDLLIIDKMRPELFGNYTGQILDIYEHGEEISRESHQNPDPVNQPADILYVNYTSGSTGTPNGAMLSHDCLTNLIQWQNQRTSIDCSLRCLQFTSINFCVSFQEIMGTLTSGGELYLIGDIERQDIDYLMNFLSKNQVEVLFLPFSYLNFLFNESSRWHQAFNHNLKHIITAGEQLKITVGLKRFLDKNPGLKLHNHYGSTEMHVVTSYTLDASTAERTPIPPAGKPIGNVSIYILDEYFNPVPVGVWGELLVAGSSQVLGYINNSALNRQKLVKHARLSARHNNQRFFRSGDIGRWLPDGNIELRGRKDFQVKIRGFRVEPGEIESKILSIENVKECVVVVKEDKARQKYLAAYISVDNIQLPEIKKKLAEELPQYMVPRLILLDNLPLMPNGKVDRERLPEPEADMQTDYTAPRDEVEKNLARIWSGILEMETGLIGIDADFFELGGHSLKATVLTSKLHKEFQVKVKLLDVFQASTIRELAERIKEMKTEEYRSIRLVEEKEYYPASYNQKRLWLLNRGNTTGSTFNMPGRITLRHKVDATLIEKALSRIIERHDSFRTGFQQVEGRLVQVVKNEIKIPLEIKDLSSLEQPDKENKIQEIYLQELAAPFDLKRMPLFRTVLLKLAEENYVLLYNLHHIISDGWSTVVLREEFNVIYEACKKGIAGEMEPLRLQYKDYAAWQDGLLADEEKMARAKEFWKDQLQGTLPVLNLPYDFSRPAGNNESAAYRWVITGEVTRRLREMAIDYRASLFMVLLAGFNIFLSKITGQSEIIIAIPAAARQHEELKNIAGLFVNTLIIRTRVNAGEDFGDFFKRLLDSTFKMLEHQGIPLELICGQLKIKYPTIPVFFNMVNIGTGNLEKLTNLEDFHMEKVQDAKFEMVCYVNEYQNGIEINCHYFKNRFKPLSIEKLMKLYEKILDKISAEPAKKIEEYTSTGKEKTLKRKSRAGTGTVKLIKKE